MIVMSIGDIALALIFSVLITLAISAWIFGLLFLYDISISNKKQSIILICIYSVVFTFLIYTHKQINVEEAERKVYVQNWVLNAKESNCKIYNYVASGSYKMYTIWKCPDGNVYRQPLE